MRHEADVIVGWVCPNCEKQCRQKIVLVTDEKGNILELRYKRPI